MRAILPAGVFSYSSNRAIAWPAVGGDVDDSGPVRSWPCYYRAVPSDEVISAPTIEDGLVEIPASVPDDLQLCDGLGLGEEGLLRAWLEMLRQTHRREELFAPLFHPEAYDLLEAAVDGVLDAARAQRPTVWLTQLRDIAAWWRERSAFGVRTTAQGGGLVLDFDCSARATVLVAHWPWPATLRPWDGAWSVLDDRTVRIDGAPRPFVGVTGVDAATVAFLTEQGYVVESGADAAACSVSLSGRDVQRLKTPRAMIEELERSTKPLVRYSRWPSEAKSAFCLAGDLDALSLRDYAQRLRPAVRARSGLGPRRRRVNHGQTTASGG